MTKDPAKDALFGTGGNTDKAGKPLNVKAEFNDVSHKRGVLSMARASDPDSASSQFFIVVKDSPFLDRQYTVFGEVVKGMDVVDRIVTESNSDTSDPRSGGKPRAYQKILKVELVEQTPDKVTAPSPAEEGARLAAARSRFGLSPAGPAVPLAGDVGQRRYFRAPVEGRSPGRPRPLPGPLLPGAGTLENDRDGPLRGRYPGPGPPRRRPGSRAPPSSRTSETATSPPRSARPAPRSASASSTRPRSSSCPFAGSREVPRASTRPSTRPSSAPSSPTPAGGLSSGTAARLSLRTAPPAGKSSQAGSPATRRIRPSWAIRFRPTAISTPTT